LRITFLPLQGVRASKSALQFNLLFGVQIYLLVLPFVSYSGQPEILNRYFNSFAVMVQIRFFFFLLYPHTGSKTVPRTSPSPHLPIFLFTFPTIEGLRASGDPQAKFSTFDSTPLPPNSSLILTKFAFFTNSLILA